MPNTFDYTGWVATPVPVSPTSASGADIDALTKTDVSSGDVYLCTEDYPAVNPDYEAGEAYAAAIISDTLYWIKLN